MAFDRRYSLPFEGGIDGDAEIDYGASIDRTVISSPNGGVRIGAARLEQCVVIEPCTIADGVVAIAAILQGDIGFGCHIAAHADIRGTLERRVEVHQGAVVALGATVGQDAVLFDRCIIETGAEVGDDATIGVEAVVKNDAFVKDGARVPRRAIIPAHGYWDPTDARQRPNDKVPIYVVDDIDDDDDDDSTGERWVHSGSEEEWSDDIMLGDGMVKGRPILNLKDFNPGSARSWALSKLARVAALDGAYGTINKALIRTHRPDLLDHPATKEILRVQPPMTAAQINEESWLALSKAHYNLYTGVKFHSGETPDWQMIGPKANDVFVLGVPERVMEEVSAESGAELYDIKRLLFEKTEWHPDQDVDYPVGWVRTLLYPRTLAVVIEVQTDRTWMKFRWSPEDDTAYGNETEEETKAIDAAALALRGMYFDSFASDAINMVVEWAFANRYREVFILDRKSRKQLGGRPPKDYYDTIPKKYTKLGVSPLPMMVETYDWVPAGMRGRSIRPNRG